MFCFNFRLEKIFNEILNMKTERKGKRSLFMFPNVDGKHFKATEAKVEIDLMIVDIYKGIVILNFIGGRGFDKKQQL